MFALVDCNNFYASCERLFRPDLRNKPVAVLSNNDGCIIARSQEVKDLGIRMGEPYFKNRDMLKKHNVTVFSSNYALYADISSRVMETLEQFSPEIEVYSIDECFVGLHHLPAQDWHALGHLMRDTVGKWTRIPVGVGIGATKTLAKAGNKLSKQHGGVCLMVEPADIAAKLARFPVGDVWGIGRRYAERLAGLGVHTAAQFRELPDAWLRQHMTVVGLRTAHELRGISCIPLEEVPPLQKGLACTRSFGTPIYQWPEMSETIAHYITRAAEKLRARGLKARYMQAFCKTSPFAPDYYCRWTGLELPMHTDYTPALIHYGKHALQGIFQPGRKYIKSGVMFTDLVEADTVMPDLLLRGDHEKQARLMAAVDAINARDGKHTIQYAGAGIRQKWGMSRNELSPNYTTCLADVPVARV